MHDDLDHVVVGDLAAGRAQCAHRAVVVALAARSRDRRAPGQAVAAGVAARAIVEIRPLEQTVEQAFEIALNRARAEYDPQAARFAAIGGAGGSDQTAIGGAHRRHRPRASITLIEIAGVLGEIRRGAIVRGAVIADGGRAVEAVAREARTIRERRRGVGGAGRVVGRHHGAVARRRRRIGRARAYVVAATRQEHAEQPAGHAPFMSKRRSTMCFPLVEECCTRRLPTIVFNHVTRA